MVAVTQAVWILIGKQVKTFDLKIDQHRRLTTKTKGDLRILYLFDLAVSVAASVIASLLLLSGDIEQNPGPGKEHCCIRVKMFIPMILLFSNIYVLLVQISTTTVLMLLKY